MDNDFRFVKNYYNSLYKGDEYGYSVQFDIWLQKYISYIPKGIALELGVGTGKNVNFLLENDFVVEGVDLSNVAIDRLNESYIDKKCKFWVEDITKIDIPKQNYSLIICSMVLSHLSETQILELTQKIKDGLITGGCVYLSTMSKDDPMNFHSVIDKAISLDNKKINVANLKRTFLDKNQIKEYFNDIDIIELADIYQKEPKRITSARYFGVIMYFGKKTKE
jgi:SAM-dependent methyltransferase